MRDFEFLQPLSVAQASQWLSLHGEDCRAMAGGTALLLAMRQRLANPSFVIALPSLAAANPLLNTIDYDPVRGLRIGALCRHIDIATSALVQAYYPILARVFSELANPQVRNQGTIGGNLCYGDPTTDPPGILMALGAQVVLQGANAGRVQRTLPLDEFLVDFFETDLEVGEVLSHVVVPPLGDVYVAKYQRFLRTAAEHRPMVNVSIVYRTSIAGALKRCEDVRIVVGATVPVARRLTGAERLLEGSVITPVLALEVALAASQEIICIEDFRGSETYRRDMVNVMIRRMLLDVE